MPLKVLILVVVALVVGSPVTAVGERKLLQAPERTKGLQGAGTYSTYDFATDTYTQLNFYHDAYSGGLLTWEIYNYGAGNYHIFGSCPLTQPVERRALVLTAQFGNCDIHNPNAIPTPFDGCTQFSTRLQGEPNLQDRCIGKDFFTYIDSSTGETVLIAAKVNTRWWTAPGKVEGVGCAFSHVVDGGIYEYMQVFKFRAKK
jgi:hypothetical protein